VPWLTLCAPQKPAAERPTPPPACVEWVVLKRSDSFTLFRVSIVIAEIVDCPRKRQFRAI